MNASIPQAAEVPVLGRNWTTKRINRELRLRGLNQAYFVQQLGRSQSLVSEVIAGKETSLFVATAVASALGRTPEEIWPRVYGRLAPATSTDASTTESTSAPSPRALAS